MMRSIRSKLVMVPWPILKNPMITTSWQKKKNPVPRYALKLREDICCRDTQTTCVATDLSTKKWETDGFRCPFFSASHGKSYHGIAYTQSFVPSPIWGCYSNPVAPRAHDIHNSGLQKHHPVGPSKSPARLGLLPSIPIFKTTSVPFRLFPFQK